MLPTDPVIHNDSYLPDAFVNAICFVPGAILHILIIVSCRDHRRVNGKHRRFKHSIVCFSLASLFIILPNLFMYTGFIFAVNFDLRINLIQCSIVRAIFWTTNPTILAVLAFDRYCTVCRGRSLEKKTLWILYGFGPVVHYTRRILDQFSNRWEPDEMCGWIYRRKNSMQIFALVAWSLVVLGALINLRVLYFLHQRRKRMEGHAYLKKSRHREANERRVTYVYLALTILPIIHMVPAIVVSVIWHITGIRVPIIWAGAYGFYALTYVTQALILIFSIRPINNSIKRLLSISKADSELGESFIVSRRLSSRQLASGSPTNGSPTSDI